METQDLEKIISKVKKMEHPSRMGGQSLVYLVDDYAVLKPREPYESDMGLTVQKMHMPPAVMRKLEELKARGVHVYPITAITDEGYIIEPRADGAEMYDYAQMGKSEYTVQRAKTLADAPQTHYDSFASDYRDILDAGLYVDSRGHMNFFYGESGFSFVDLNRLLASEGEIEEKKSMLAKECLLPVIKNFYRRIHYWPFPPKFSETEFHELQESNIEIFEKCKNAVITNKIADEGKLKTLNPSCNSLPFKTYLKNRDNTFITYKDL